MQNNDYNIKTYTDQECFDILNLNNPTDRELEMKILSFMDKYETKSPRLYEFFESMYDRFFSTGEDEEGDDHDDNVVEGFTAEEAAKADPGKQIVLKEDTTKVNEVKPTNKNDVIQVSQTDYVKDKYKLNPVQRKTILKMISIDSQFREDPTNTLSTNFTMNLSESIDNVISMKLYSVQIPYTWYTINSSFGSNFFYIKGNSPGINNGDHDIKVEIRSGTYNPTTFVNAIQAKFDEFKTIATNLKKNDDIYKTILDVSFGETKCGYNLNAENAKFVFQFDLKKKFNETDYQLYFPTWSTPNVEGEEKSLTIPSFLGFNHDLYYPYIAYSSLKILKPIGDPTELTNSTIYTLRTGINNYFTIYQYVGTPAFDLNTSTIIRQIPIYITLDEGNKTRDELLTNLHANMQSNILLDPNYSGFRRINNSDGLHSHFEISVKLSRKEILQTDNSKLAIKFPAETDIVGNHIWTGTDSCFVFADVDTIELNEVVSETETLLTNYIIADNSAQIIVECVKPNYNVVENTRTITVARSVASGFPDGYLLSSYIAAVNNAIVSTNNTTKIPNLLDNGEFNISTSTANTQLFISNDYATFNFDITRFFTQESFIVDLSSCFLSTNPFNFDASINNLTNTDFLLNRPFSSAPSISISALNNKLVLIPKTTGGPNGNGYGNQNSGNIELFFTTGVYDTLNNLLNSINNDFINFVDADNYQIMRGSSISFANSVITLNLKINKVLTEADYRVKFQDNSIQNSWQNYLYFDTSYNLADHIQTSFADISGSTQVYNNTIRLTTLNNKFVFRPYTNGVADAGGANDIVFELPLNPDNTKTYTREGLIDEIQLLFDANPLTAGSTISLVTYSGSNLQYTNIRMNINKTFYSEDFKLVFYDPTSFVYCNVGVAAQNVTYDSTLGWLLGFQSFTEYNLADFTQITAQSLSSENYAQNIYEDSVFIYSYDSITKKIAIRGDTVLNTNLYNYFLVVLDDFIQNHVNAGLITISSLEKDVALPSYSSRIAFECDPVTGQKVAISASNKFNNNLNSRQLYAANQILQDKRTKAKSYAVGPYMKDVFALIPLKLTGMTFGQTYMEFGGTMQNQDRKYFGPVRIQKLSVKLMNDKGSIVSLNGANWSFCVICEILNQQDN
jgi:hypothetical protein